MILKRMKRRHSRGDAVAFCARMRRLRPEIAFGADLIAGFPTETEAMFAGSMRLVDDCGLAFLHVFPFSPRPGTPAARMPQVDRATVKERAARLRETGDTALARHLRARIGSQVEVLAERERVGRTESFAEMELTEPVQPGRVLRARVTGSSGKRLRGETIAPMCGA
jgi:threonylcarbamoyladenosine tRNA methylthiotransferase MtaB